MKRFASVIRLAPEKFEEYKAHHDRIWPEVLEKIRESHITNYTIFYRNGLLFSYYEYVGIDFDADMRAVDDHPACREWQRLMRGMQEPVEWAHEGEWWAAFEELFHVE